MFRRKIFSNAAVLSLVVILFSSCESNRWFQSEDTLKAKIQRTWDMVLIPANDGNGNPRPPIEWIFKEGTFQQFIFMSTGIDSTYGNYSISTTYTKAFLTITDVPPHKDVPYGLNATWEIIELDGGLLFIATDYDGSTGLRQREFTER
ncbi:MAG TPA: hypothetical protein VI757_05990 [Bacteroidia bacterium]|nr:hypothetical protein [Bacteroidia bacterium]